MPGPAAANTGGKPSADRKPWAWVKTDGGEGRTVSRALMTLDWSRAESSAADELLISVLARSQNVTRAATTATTVPRTASTVRPNPGCSRTTSTPPRMRPTMPRAKAIPTIVVRATAVLAVGRVGPPHGHRGQQRSQEQAAEEAQDGADLHHRTHPGTLVGGQQGDDDEHDVDDVHRGSARAGGGRWGERSATVSR